MRITFRRFPDYAEAYSVIERDDGVVYHMREFTRSGTALPHDLRHLVVERELGITDGIWGGIAAGAVYQSMTPVRGLRPPHAAERPAALPPAALPSAPALAAAVRALQVEAARWARLRPGQELSYEWRPRTAAASAPGPDTVPGAGPVPRPREPGDRRHPPHPGGRRPR